MYQDKRGTCHKVYSSFVDNINNIYAKTFFSELSETVEDVVISPGSRSGALSIEAENNSKLSTHIVIDERSAAFFALGLSKAKGKPTILICTSGSALGHYYPAIMEAHHDNIPLIVCSADRTPEEIDTGHWQSTNQSRFYGEYVRWFHNLEIHTQLNESHMKNVATQAIEKANGIQPGPVHLNFHIRPPLWEITEPLKEASSKINNKSSLQNNDLINRNIQNILDANKIDLTNSENLLIYIGRNCPFSSLEIQEFVNQIDSPVINNYLSNVQIESNNLISITELQNRQFDSVIRFGQLPTSREYFETVANISNQVCVVEHDFWSDPFGVGIKHVFVENQNCDREDTAILIGNSSIVRDCENEKMSLALEDADDQATIYSQRGLAGIDGFISVLAGVCQSGVHNEVIGLCGDLTFLHDISALNLLKKVTNYKLIVLNNNGGKLFKDINPNLKSQTFDKIFITPHGENLPTMTKGFGLNVEEMKLADFSLIKAQSNCVTFVQ